MAENPPFCNNTSAIGAPLLARLPELLVSHRLLHSWDAAWWTSKDQRWTYSLVPTESYAEVRCKKFGTLAGFDKNYPRCSVRVNNCTTRNQDGNIPSKAICKSGAMHKVHQCNASKPPHYPSFAQSAGISWMWTAKRKDGSQLVTSGPDPIMRLFKFNPPIGNITNIYDLWYSSNYPWFCVSLGFNSLFFKLILASSGFPSTLPVAGRSRSASVFLIMHNGGATVRRRWTDLGVSPSVHHQLNHACFLGSLLPGLGCSFLFFENTRALTVDSWSKKVGKQMASDLLFHTSKRPRLMLLGVLKRGVLNRGVPKRGVPKRGVPKRGVLRRGVSTAGRAIGTMSKKNMSDDLDFRSSTSGLTDFVHWRLKCNEALVLATRSSWFNDHSFQIQCSLTQYLRDVSLLMLRGGKIQFQHNRQNLFDCIRIHCAHAVFFILGPWSCSATHTGTNNLWSKRFLQFLGLQQL